MKTTTHDLTSYMPDSVVPVYEDFKDTLVSWLQKFGIVSADGSAGAFRQIDQP